MRIYEGMFVLDDARCNENWQAVVHEVHGILEKNQAEIFTSEKWDERRLAYPIAGHTRGAYLLIRFTAPADALATIERDCQLNDTILRVLFTRDEHSEKLHKAGLLKLRPGDQGEPPPPTTAQRDTDAFGTGRPDMPSRERSDRRSSDSGDRDARHDDQ